MNLPHKVMQICVSAHPSQGIDNLYALCADGSVWRLEVASMLDEDSWVQLPFITGRRAPQAAITNQ